MMKISRFFCGTALLFASCLIGAELDAPSRLENWQGGKVAASEGKTFLTLADGESASMTVNLVEGKSYCFELDKAVLSGDDGMSQIRFRALQNGRDVSESAWEELSGHREFAFRAPQGGKTELKLAGKGSSRVHNVRLREIASLPDVPFDVVLQFPAWRNTVFTDQRGDVQAKITLKNPVVSAVVTLTADKEPGKILGEITTAGGEFSFAGSKDLPVGKYTLSITPQDADHKPLLGSAIPVIVRDVPAVCYRYNPADNTFYRNGEPVHFHGFYHYIPGLDYLYRRNGVTTFIMGAGTAEVLLKKLDEAYKKGYHIIYEPRARYYRQLSVPYSLDNWKKKMREILTPEVLNHPALCGYYSVDEPTWNGFPVSELMEIKKFLNELDPTRPVWVNEAPRGDIATNRQSAACGNVFGVDNYPIPKPKSDLENYTVTSIGDYMRRCREIAGENVPIWMVLQGFAWGEFDNEPPIYPNREETRYMALEAMATGANSVLYWGANYNRNKAFFVELLDQVSEIANLSKLWQAGNTLKIDCAKGIETFAGMVDGERFIVARNTTNAALDSKIDLAGLYELPSGLPAQDAVFAPYTARVFASVPRYPGDFAERIPYDKEAEAAALTALNDHFSPGRPYTGSAQWIWYPGDHNTEICSNTLVRDFSLAELPERARFGISADDHAEVWINGKKLASTVTWFKMKYFDALPLLQKGDNRIELRAKSEEAPSGILAELVLQFAGGRSETIVTDETWQALKPGIAPCPVEVIAPYGKGPWSERVSVVD